MSWRLAESLKHLRVQINTAYPNRSKVSDGSIGDAAHSSRTSDHNPNAKGVVCAIDVTHDPVNGVDGNHLAETLVENKDARLKYVIWNKRIASRLKGWKWRPYTGINAHQHHVHISVEDNAKLYDKVNDWDLDIATVTKTVKKTALVTPQVIEQDSQGAENKPSTYSPLESYTEQTPPVEPPADPTPAAPVIQEPVVNVPQARPEIDDFKDEFKAEAKAQIKSRFLAIPTIIIGMFSAMWERLTSGDTNLVYWLIGAVVIVLLGFIALNKYQDYHDKEIALQKEKENNALKLERERQAHELTLLQAKSAMDRNLQTIRINPQPIRNSDADLPINENQV